MSNPSNSNATQPGAGARRKNLVIVRAGDSSLHQAWLTGERDFDLAVSYYGEKAQPFSTPCEYFVAASGSKWEGLYSTLSSPLIPWQEYDYVMLPDDDLEADAATLNRFFSITHELQPILSQPSLTVDSYFTHQSTLQQEGLVYRTTNFVEIMTPCFRRDFLEQALPTFSENLSGFGLETLWSQMAGSERDRMIIVDATAVRHTRPVGLQGNGTGQAGHSSLEEQAVLFKKHGISKALSPMTITRVSVDERRPKTALVVGAGFAGAVAARVLADAGWQVQVIEKKNHIGGNAFDCLDDHGILIHPYGPHIFHTNSRKVMEFLSQYTEWRFYEHRVRASVGGSLVPMPINRTTLNQLYDLDLTPKGAADYLESVREVRERIETSEDLVLNAVGRDLCDKLYRGYTQKQWGKDLSELLAGVAARIPVRTNDDDRYFEDSYQFMPRLGYSYLFARMLAHRRINLQLGTTLNEINPRTEFDHLVYTGPVDEFFNYKFGKLQYRSLEFEYITVDSRDLVQPVATVNYPNEFEYTRSTEFRHMTGQQADSTSLLREYPRADGEPYYPVPAPRNAAMHERYKEAALAVPNVTFVGRLAQYKYYNMDQVVAASMAAARRIIDSDTSSSLPSPPAASELLAAR